MIWLTWRQFRVQAWVAMAALTSFAVVLTITGANLRELYDASGIAGCSTDCGRLSSAFLSQAKASTAGIVYVVTIGVLFVVPAIVGIFWGAPTVARELENGTYRLAWNQSVTRTRWLAAKLLGGCLASMAAVGLFSLAVTWWAGPLDQESGDRMTPLVFAARGIVPIGYAAFAFALGVVAGTVLRRTIPAMAVTLLVVAAAQLVMPLGIRGHLIPPVQVTAPFESRNLRSLYLADGGLIEVTASVEQSGGWVVSNKTVTADGKPFAGPYDERVCGMRADPDDCNTWLDAQGLRQIAEYQPASRFWALQWAETGIFLTLGGMLAGFCFWWVRRRLA